MQNVETTGVDNVRHDDAVKNQDGTLKLRFIEKCYEDMAEEKNINCKQLGASASIRR